MSIVDPKPSRYHNLPTAAERAERLAAERLAAEEAAKLARTKHAADRVAFTEAKAGVDRLGLEAYLETVPGFLGKARRDHAQRYARGLEDAARWKAASDKAAAESLARQQAAIKTIYAIEEGYPDDDEQRTHAHLFDERGEPFPGKSPANLRELAGMLEPGKAFSPHAANYWKRVRAWHESSGGEWPEALAGTDFEDKDTWLTRNWVLTFDNRSIVPPGLKGAKLREWCAAWRDSIPAIAGAELIVFAVPRERVAFMTWDETPSSGIEWAEQISGHVAEGAEPRFAAYRKWPYRVPCEPVHLASAHEAAPATDAAAVFAALPTGRLVTGWAAFDGLFRGEAGLPMGARVGIGGDPKQGKSAVAISLAHAAMSRGYCVAWRAEDESIGDVMTRRLQQLGLSPAEALRPSPEALERLSAQPFLLADTGSLADFWERAHEWAAGRPLVMIGDSLQTIAEAEGSGDRGGLEALVKTVVECQKRWPAIFLATTEITAPMRPKGSTRVAYSFTTMLNVKRADDRVTVTVGPSRHNGEGRVDLVLDFDRQRLLEPEAAAVAARSVELRAAILGAIGSEVVSRSKLETRLDVDTRRLRAELVAMVEDGTLVQSAKGYRRA